MPMPVSDDLDDDAALAVAASLRVRIGDRPALGRELHGVLDQVPEDLLEPRRVGVDVAVPRRPGPRRAAGRLPETSLRQIWTAWSMSRWQSATSQCSGILPRTIRITSSRSSISRAWRLTFWRIISSVGRTSSGSAGRSSIDEAASRIGFSGVRSSWREDGEELGLRPVGRLGLLLRRPQFLLGRRRSRVASRK